MSFVELIIYRSLKLFTLSSVKLRIIQPELLRINQLSYLIDKIDEALKLKYNKKRETFETYSKTRFHQHRHRSRKSSFGRQPMHGIVASFLAAF